MVHQKFKEVIKIIHVTNLTGDCNAFSIFSPNSSIVDHSVFCIPNLKTVWVCTVVCLLMIPLKDQKTANHHTSPSFASFTMYGCNSLYISIQIFKALFTKFKYYIKRWWIMIIKGKALNNCILFKVPMSIFSF